MALICTSKFLTSIARSKTKQVLIILSIIFCVVACVLASSLLRRQTIQKIETLVQNENYIEAYKLIDEKILATNENNEYIQKAWVVGAIEDWYKDAPDETSRQMAMTCYLVVILRSIGNHQQLVDWGLYDYTEAMVLDSVQQIENLREKPWDGTTEQIIYKEYNDLSNTLVEPYRTNNPDGAKEYISFLLSSIDYGQSEQHTKEQYDKNNPLQITEKSTYKENGYWYCVGTLSNVSNKTYCYVKIKVTYYDENMDILTTDWTYAVDSVGIDSGENKQFEIMTKVTGNVEKYKVEVIDYQ